MSPIYTSLRSDCLGGYDLNPREGAPKPHCTNHDGMDSLDVKWLRAFMV